MLTTGFYLALVLRIYRAMTLVRDVDIDNFPSRAEQCANTRPRKSDESFDEFCGLFFDIFSVQLCLRIEMKFYL